jgi:ppGpp synthetase/RelA/SpoT-type nucleotidyltranferase
VTDVADARRLFVAELPAFEALALDVSQALRRSTAASGIPCQVSNRVKDISSFVSKAYRKRYADPWSSITDKVGVRVTVDNVDSIDDVVALVGEQFEVILVQDKARDLRAEDKIGYAGVHLQVAVPCPDNVRRECEIQIRTAAQGLWAEMSHHLLYKPSAAPDEESRRALTRLAALMEIFDEEVGRRMAQMLAAPGYLLEELMSLTDSLFYRFSVHPYDRALCRYLLIALGPTLPTGDPASYASILRTFTDDHSAKLTEIFARYADNDDVPLLHVPGCLVVFERLEHDQFTLEDAWSETFPVEDLDGLRAVWGV